MPLKGVITAAGKELTWEEYVTSTDTTLFPYPIRRNIFSRLATERSRWISPSSLTGCLRKSKWEFERDFYLPEKIAYILFRGVLVHNILELDPRPGALIEHEISYHIPELDFTIGGRLDLWEDSVLWDYKSLSDRGIPMLAREGVKEEHIWQTNIYRYLLKLAQNIDTTEIRIAYVSMSDVMVSGRHFFAPGAKGKPPTQVYLEPVPLYPETKVYNYIAGKIRLILDGYAPPATPVDWICKSCYFKNECENTVGRGTSVVSQPLQIPRTPF